MQESEARSHLQMMMIALQRYRGITKEQLGPDSTELHLSDELSAEMWPWIFGDKCPLPTIAKMLNADKIVPMDYYNMMFILDRFIPEIKAVVNMNLIQSRQEPIADGPPGLEILKGWTNAS